MTNTPKGRSAHSSETLQQALNWWQQRTIARQAICAELLKEQVWQELFALRRHLSLDARLETSSITHSVQYLSSIERSIVGLNTLVQTLYPAYIDDSLPLALQYQVAVWQQRLPWLQIRAKLPPRWYLNCPYYNWLVLHLLDEWLLALPVQPTTTASLAITLTEDPSIQRLDLRWLEHNPTEVSAVMQGPVGHLITLLEVLLTGQVTIQTQGQETMWQICWKPCSTVC